MSKLVLVDGNSIMNRAFYGIMGSKMLMTKDGKYTNAVYGFLAILFKVLEDENPDYLVVAFDLKAPTARHKLYDGYKANRKGMPEELAEQMPMIKEILRAMNIDIIEKEGYEADDVLGTLSRYGESKGLEVVILSGDRDTFQLATDKVTIRIPHTKGGKTETDFFNREKILEKYELEPKQLIEVKGLQGDTSDNIPGVPGIGEKTALKLIKEYGNIDNIYEKLEKGESNLKGKQKENIENNKELAMLSRTLGTINLEVPIEDDLEDFKIEKWNEEKVYNIFKELNFKRYIERFNLGNNEKKEEINLENLYEIKEENIENIIEKINKTKKMTFEISTKKDENPEKIIKEKITSISIYIKNENKQNKNNQEGISYYIDLEKENIEKLKEIFENNEIEKIGNNLSKTYILLNQEGIKLNNLNFDAKIAKYLLDPTNKKLKLEEIIEEELELEINKYLKPQEETETQLNLFSEMTNDNNNEEIKKELGLKSYLISKLEEKLTKKLKEIGSYELFKNIEMPTIEVLSQMQINGIHINEEKLIEFGKKLQKQIETKTKIIYELAGEEFNINSNKQLGELLFEKKQLPVIKKTKSGYSTDVEVLEKLKKEDPIISEILEYRQLMKLNSTYVEGLKPYINPKTKKIHSFFHQTITATGRISSTEPNLQNIPTRFELGKQVRKLFEPEENKVYIDADYSQIELRVLAHISKDENMVKAFKNNEDIHKEAASKVFKTPIENVTSEQRTSAKAVNFGIVYGISDYGLGEQLGISRKQAKEYIEEYLEEYKGIDTYMKETIEKAKEEGYVETLFNRRRYVPELKSKNYNIRQFGQRVAMNTPIQGTAADIMKIAMINVYKKLNEKDLKSKIILQVHDEMMLETPIEEIEEVKKIVKEEMEKAVKLEVPLIAELSEAKNWYECK